MSRGGLLLRCVRERRELPYEPRGSARCDTANVRRSWSGCDESHDEAEASIVIPDGRPTTPTCAIGDTHVCR